MKYPKLWDGPSPVGEALVRALQQTGEPFLRASTADGVTAATMNGFQQVRQGGAVEYVSSGTVKKDGKENTIGVASADYRLPFLPVGASKTAGSNKRKVMRLESTTTSSIFKTYSYEYPPSETPVTLTWIRRAYEGTAYRGRTFSRHYWTAGDFSNFLELPGAGPMYFPSSPSRRLISVDEKKTPTYIIHEMLDVGVTDIGGAPLAQPAYSLWTWGPDAAYNQEQYLFPTNLLPNELGRIYMPPIITPVGQGKLFALLFSNWMYTTNYDDDVSARARLFYSQNGGRSWRIQDVTDVFLSPDINAGLREPEMIYAIKVEPPAPPGEGEFVPPLRPDFWATKKTRRNRAEGLPEGASTHFKFLSDVREEPLGSGMWTYTVNSRRVGPHVPTQMDVYLSNILWVTSIAVPLDNDEALLTGVYVSTEGTTSAMFRLKPSAPMMLLLSITDPGNFSYVQAMVYLGGGAVLAKRVNRFGPNITNADVKYELSADAGATWSEVPASGLPGLRKNRFFGNFTVIKPYVNEQDMGVVLTTAFDEAEMGYFVYESTDAGVSWTRRGCLARTEQFYRVDSMVSGDGGNNFSTVSHPGSRERPGLWNPAIEEMAVKY